MLPKIKIFWNPNEKKIEKEKRRLQREIEAEKEREAEVERKRQILEQNLSEEHATNKH